MNKRLQGDEEVAKLGTDPFNRPNGKSRPSSPAITVMRLIRSMIFLVVVSATVAKGIAAGEVATVNPGPGMTKSPHVFGKPRMTQGHPCTLWDKEDVAHYQELIKTSPELKLAFEQLSSWGDERIQQPLNVPVHALESDGKWTFPAFKRGYQNPEGKWMWEWKFNGQLQQRTADIANLGVLYALFGDEKYAAFAKSLLLALADAYGYRQNKTQTDPNGYDHFEAYGFDGGDSGMFLTKVCSGYDLIYNLPTITPEDRAHIGEDLIRPLAERLKQAKWMYTGHDKWGMICLYGVFISAVTLDDQDLVHTTLYGFGSNQANPDGGFMHCFNPSCMRADGRWGANRNEEDRFSSLSVLISVAEVMWHHGLDIYSYQNMALKKPFDAALPPTPPAASSLASSNPDYGKLLGLSGINAYEYAFRRYQDPRYLPIISKLKPTLVMEAGGLPSLFDPHLSVQ